MVKNEQDKPEKTASDQGKTEDNPLLKFPVLRVLKGRMVGKFFS
jgi:hypothetical protein